MGRLVCRYVLDKFDEEKELHDLCKLKLEDSEVGSNYKLNPVDP